MAKKNRYKRKAGKKADVDKKKADVDKIQNKELLEASKKTFSSKEVTEEDLKNFQKTYRELKHKGDLTKKDERAARNVVKRYKKLLEKGRMKKAEK